jgi:polyisoprenyl-phosphate glycosyltransferase
MTVTQTSSCHPNRCCYIVRFALINSLALEIVVHPDTVRERVMVATSPKVLIIPVFNDRVSCAALLGQMAALLKGQDWRICVIDDGSTIDWPLISDLMEFGLSGVILRLPHNMGHQAAIACGIGYVAANWPGRTVVIMDADGEDRPDVVPTLLLHLNPDKPCAVVAERRRRTEGLRFRVFYVIYKALFRLLSGHTINFGNFMVLSWSAVHRLASMHQIWLHLPAALIASRIPLRYVSTDRGRRYFGKSQMNFISLAVHGMRALMVFAESVLIRLIFGGIGLMLVAAALMLIALGLKITGNATPGWFTSVVGLLAVMVMQTLGVLAALLILAGTARGQIVRDASKTYLHSVASVEIRP